MRQLPESQLPDHCRQRTALKTLSRKRIRDSNLLPFFSHNLIHTSNTSKTKNTHQGKLKENSIKTLISNVYEKIKGSAMIYSNINKPHRAFIVWWYKIKSSQPKLQHNIQNKTKPRIHKLFFQGLRKFRGFGWVLSKRFGS